MMTLIADDYFHTRMKFRKAILCIYLFWIACTDILPHHILILFVPNSQTCKCKCCLIIILL